MTALTCDMRRDCAEPVTHADSRGYLYCTEHARQRADRYNRVHRIPARELAELTGKNS